MKIVVCIRQGLDGEISPFDGAAYEAALRIDGADITLLSMASLKAGDFLLKLTRLGAKKAILLSDSAFAGADTLATAYTLSLAIKKINPDFIFCGRQTLIGDTGQTGSMLAALLGSSLATNVMKIDSANSEKMICQTRSSSKKTLHAPALLTFERIYSLRLPSIRSKVGELEILNASDLGADIERCGLRGSPTRVIESKENTGGKRKCTFIGMNELERITEFALSKETPNSSQTELTYTEKLKLIFATSEEALLYAKGICEKEELIDQEDPDAICNIIAEKSPDAVLFPADEKGRADAAYVAAKMNLGLCADCTSLQTDGETLFMIRPAGAGSIMAKVKSVTRPALATVRTVGDSSSRITVAAGYGARNAISKIKSLAKHFNAEIAASRKAVDADILPYSAQVGLTGKSAAPSVYIAVGISGAVHHIVGMERSSTVIAINPDKDASIFDYADYGIIASAEDIPNFD